jgi:hypothetical protein
LDNNAASTFANFRGNPSSTRQNKRRGLERIAVNSSNIEKTIGNGCTSAAVRMTKQWKEYQNHRQSGRERHRSRSNIVYDNFDEIDKRIDRESQK